MTFGEWIERETLYREHTYESKHMSIAQLYEMIKDLKEEQRELALCVGLDSIKEKYPLLIQVYTSELVNRVFDNHKNYSTLYH